ncbi:MAG: branched-chain amino acid ABC transporter permease [Nitrospinota bacterium]
MFRSWSKSQWATFVVGILVLAAIPLFEANDGVRKWMDILMIAILAVSWNFIGGLTGYPSFAPAAFFGLGAYMTAILMNAEFFFLTTLFIGAFAAGLLALILGIPILRLKGHYFAIASYGVAEALREFAENLEITGGGDGINLPIIGGGVDFFTRFFYYSMLAVAILAVITQYAVTRHRLGFGLVAIRENEDAAGMLGVETTKYKVIAFVLSAIFPAMAGGVYAYRAAFLEPIDVFDVLFSIKAIVMSLLGGMGLVMGPVLGAVFMEYLNDFLWGRFLEFHSAFLGIIMVLIVIFMPQGFFFILQEFRARRSWKAVGSVLVRSIQRYRV